MTTAMDITLHSPFRAADISNFDNEDSFPNITFIIQGLERSLRLHDRELRMSSTAFDGLFKSHPTSKPIANFDPSARTLAWACERTATDEVDRRVLVKWLRFCYGEDQTFSIAECPAALAALIQLQLKTKEDVKSVIEKHMIDAAEKNVDVGTDLLCECAFENEECHCGHDQSRVDVALAKVVVTPENIRNCPEIADKYLMKLPVDGFESIRYEDMMLELRLCLKYVRYHQELSNEEKKRVLKFEEFEECCKLGLVNGGLLVEECIEMLKIKEDELVKTVQEARKKAIEDTTAEAAVDKAKAIRETKEQAEREKARAVQEAKERAAIEKRELKAQMDKVTKEKEEMKSELKCLKEQMEKWKPFIEEEERKRREEERRKEEEERKREEERRRREEEGIKA